jgi:tetratricopeptide (TPR) repeat protein
MKKRQTIISTLRVFFALSITALLSACATVSGTVTEVEHNAGEVISPSAANSPPGNTVNNPAKPAEGVFPEEALYQLLVADMALTRGQFEFALEKYIQQARETRDIEVIKVANRIASHRGDTSALLETALLWLEVSPNHAMAHRAALLAYALQAEPLKALPHAYWLYVTEGDIEAFLAITAIGEDSGQALSKKDFIAPLIQAYENLALAPEKRPAVKLAQAILYREGGELETAVKTVKQFLALAPDNERGLLFLVQTLHQQDRLTEAVGLLEEALQRIPGNQSLRLQYARFLTLTNRPHAIIQFEILRADNPHNQQVNFLLALLHLNQGSVALATDLFHQASSDPSLSSDAHYHLAAIADRQRDTAGALQHYQQVRNGRNYLAAASRSALLLTELETLESARNYLQKLRAEQPDQSPSLFQVESNLLLGSDQPAKAFTLLSEGLDAHPNDTQLLYARSMVAELQDNFQLAERDLRALLTQDADNSAALNALGYTMLLHTDRHKEAHKLIRRAYLLNPGEPAILDSLGWALFTLGDAQQALPYLEKALAIMVDPEIAAHLGEVQWFLGDRQAAIQTWKRGLEQDPQHKIIQETIERHRIQYGEQLGADAFGIESRLPNFESPSGEDTP